MSEGSQPLLKIVVVYQCVRLLADSRNLNLTGGWFLHAWLQPTDGSSGYVVPTGQAGEKWMNGTSSGVQCKGGFFFFYTTAA